MPTATRSRKRSARSSGRPSVGKTKAKVATPKPRAGTKSPQPVRVSTHPPIERSAQTLALIDRLRALCLALPDTVEQLAWGEPTWRIGGRMYAQCDTYHHGNPHLSVIVPAPLGAQTALIDADPDRFFCPAYVGGRGWVGIVLDTDPDWGMVASLLRTAYDLIAQKRTRPRPH